MPNPQPEIQYTIFLAEDNGPDVLLVQEALDAHDLTYDLVIVEDGEEAFRYLDRLDSGDAEKCPDLILLDLNLPRRSGTEILARLRTSPKCANTPVVVLTSSDSPRDRAIAKDLGAAGYFRKPADLEIFLSLGGVVKEVLQRSSQAPSLA